MAKNEETETTRERQPFKVRELSRLNRSVVAYTRMARIAQEAGWAAPVTNAIQGAVDSLTTLGKYLEKLQDDFVPPGSYRNQIPEKGDVITLNEEVRALYGLRKDEELTVVEVIAVGGDEKGRGRKYHVKTKRADGTIVVAPAALIA